jgi:ABC-type transport system involved in multi-copper enzyme maturation permease subunit
MTMIYILCIIAANMIFGYEHTNHTLKNSISYGISRFTIYFSKLIVEILYSVIAFVIIIGIHIISAYLLLENSGIQELNILLRSCLACLPLFVFGLATMNCFAFNIESSSGAMTAAGGVMIAFPLVCNLLGMKFKLFANLGNLLPWNLLDMESYDQAKNVLIMHWSTAKGFQDCILIGLAETIIIGIIGYLVFRRMEIK